MFKTVINSILLLIIVYSSSCVSRNVEELNPISQTCSTDTITYSYSILKVLEDNSCLVCHSASSVEGGVNLEGYTNVKKYAENGKLYGAVSHTSGSPMPKGGSKITQNEIDRVQAWICNGSLNN